MQSNDYHFYSGNSYISVFKTENGYIISANHAYFSEVSQETFETLDKALYAFYNELVTWLEVTK